MKTKTINIILILLIILYLEKIIPSLIFLFSESSPIMDYGHADLLINYTGGFVRRGLIGQFLFIMDDYFNLNPFLFIKYFSYTCYFFIIFYFLYNFYKNKISLFFLLLPYTLVLRYYAGLMESRDFFLLILLLFAIRIILSQKNKIGKIIMLNAIFIIGILSHEMFFFFSVPICALLLKSRDSNYNYLKVGLHLIPTFACLLFVVLYHGNAQSVLKILESYKSYKSVHYIFLDHNIPPALATLEDNLDIFTGLRWNFINYSKGFNRITSHILFIISTLFILINFDKTNVNVFGQKAVNQLDKNILSNVFIVQLISFFPIFMVAGDWHRFLNITLLSSLMVSLEIFKQKGSLNFPPIISSIQAAINKGFCFFINPSRDFVLIVTLFNIIPYVNLGNQAYLFSNTYIMIIYRISSICYHIGIFFGIPMK